MIDKTRSTLLQQARRHTSTIVIGTLAGTGVLTVGIALTADGAFGDDGDTPSADPVSDSGDQKPGGIWSGWGDDDSDDDGDDDSDDDGGEGSDDDGGEGSDGGTHSS